MTSDQNLASSRKPASSYTIITEQVGFKTAEVKDAKVILGMPTSLHLNLESEAIGETVTVATAPLAAFFCEIVRDKLRLTPKTVSAYSKLLCQLIQTIYE